MTKVVAIVSGGMDSTVLLHKLHEQNYDVHALSFDYGQRHKKEIDCARIATHRFGMQHDVVDLTNLTHLISNSALTSQTKVETTELANHVYMRPGGEIEVPEGHYAEDNMKKTVVPNRNMIMLSIAGGVAVNDGAVFVATGVHAGDHFVYPDCREQFINSIGQTLKLANEGFGFDHAGAAIFAPFLNWSKADIAYEGIRLGVDFSLTWSCYKGGDVHCGKCGTCVERLEAIDEAEHRWIATNHGAFQHDKTEYEDTEFWKLAVVAAK